MPASRERQRAAERRALVRACILRMVRHAAPYALSLQIIETGLDIVGLHADVNEIVAGLQHFVDLGWVAETHPARTTAARRWRLADPQPTGGRNPRRTARQPGASY